MPGFLSILGGSVFCSMLACWIIPLQWDLPFGDTVICLSPLFYDVLGALNVRILCLGEFAWLIVHIKVF